MPFAHNLPQVLGEINATRNEIAVESKTRPATLLDMHNGTTKRLELGTMERILDAINAKAAKEGVNKTYTLNDLFTYQLNDK
ncbi:XRE family transcriptional regulator [Planococcus beigongshangi]|uniref:XRE family transcriptional regulator n=1 Tax=Planococcus beigongshangi TaxID=2782536 RepID=UPI00193B324B|nr:XRE family transcriptional regulator [Planococcus beigongshangi]